MNTNYEIHDMNERGDEVHPFNTETRSKRESYIPDILDDNPAQVFDALTSLDEVSARSKLSNAFDIIAYPGESQSQSIRAGDIILRRALGEGQLARYDFVNDSLVLNNQINPEARMTLDTLILRPRDSDNEPYSEDPNREQVTNDYSGSAENPAILLAVAGTLISGSELGLGIFDRLNEHVFNGAFSVTAQAASYIHNPSPRGLQTFTRRFGFGFSAHHPRYGIGSQNFYFQLTLEYDGFNIKRASIVEDRGRSSSLVSSDFNISFNPASYSAPNDPVAAIVFNISGRWNPIGRGDESFDGSLIIDAQGNVLRLRINSPSSWVMRHRRITASGGGTVPRPTRARHVTSVHFHRPGGVALAEDVIRHLHRWFNGLPIALRRSISGGDIPVTLTGRASTTASVQRNQEIARRRTQVVAAMLTDLAGTSSNIVRRVHGELGARTADNRESRAERRVDLDITYVVYR